MSKLYYSHKYNSSTKAWRVIVKTQEEKQKEVLQQAKKILGL